MRIAMTFLPPVAIAGLHGDRHDKTQKLPPPIPDYASSIKLNDDKPARFKAYLHAVLKSLP